MSSDAVFNPSSELNRPADLSSLSCRKSILSDQCAALSGCQLELNGAQYELEVSELVRMFHNSDEEYFRTSTAIKANGLSSDAVSECLDEGNSRKASIEFFAGIMDSRLAANEAVAEEHLAQYLSDAEALNAAIADHNQNVQRLCGSDNDCAKSLTLDPVTPKTTSCSPFSGYPASFRARRDRVKYARDAAIAGIRRTLASLSEAFGEGAAQ